MTSCLGHLRLNRNLQIQIAWVLCNITQLQMLKGRKRLGEAPRKKNHSSTLHLDDNEFSACIGDIPEESPAKKPPTTKDNPPEDYIEGKKEKSKNLEIVNLILNILPTPPSTTDKPAGPQLIDESQEVIKTLLPQPETKPTKPTKSKPRPSPSNYTVSNNWMTFLKNSKPKDNTSAKFQQMLQKNPAMYSQFVAIDCEYVECQAGEQVTRISIVNEDLTQLFESYIRPKSKIIDYRTSVSGISYTHIKNAPLWQDVKPKVEKILFKKVVVGHTIEKDLGVLGMEGWFGFKDVIDINKFSQYQENGKVQSLKRLAFVFLEKNIQTGMHSSLQDAKVTMQLFWIKKDKILQEIQRNKKEQERLRRKHSKTKQEH